MVGAIGSRPGLDPAVMQKLKAQARDYEGIFLNTLMKEMFATVKTDDDVTGGSFATETWRGMQSERLADALADSGGIGLADSILPDLIALQEAAQGQAKPGATP
jgi:Rod binding domain-containing protein